MLLDGVSYRYARSGPWVLREVSVAVEPGGVVVLSGRNGEGKSTLLHLCAGVLRPASGRISGRPSVVGWVPERFPAAQPFTAAGYLTRAGRMRGLTRAAAHAAVGYWADRLRLTPFLGVRLADLSKGTAQKVGLAQALLVPPGLLILDEPWEGLDSVARAEVPAIVAEVVSAGGIVLVSDHRGETARLPDAARWRVAGQRVEPAGPGERYIIEIDVAAAEATATADALRAAGHGVVGVRPR